MTRHFAFPTDPSGEIVEFSFDQYDDFSGMGEWNPVTVESTSDSHHVLQCDSYYSPTGVFKLEITAELSIALKIFRAAMQADTDLQK